MKFCKAKVKHQELVNALIRTCKTKGMEITVGSGKTKVGGECRKIVFIV